MQSTELWVVDFAARPTSEQVRLQAAKEILDRAGLKPTERIETITVDKSTDELRKELAQLMGPLTESEEDEFPQTLNERLHNLHQRYYGIIQRFSIQLPVPK